MNSRYPLPPPLQLQQPLLLTPERSMPSSPTISPAIVSHTNATTRHLHTNDTTAVDFIELTKLLQNVVSTKKKDRRFSSASFQPTSPTSSTNSLSSTNSSISSTRPSYHRRPSSLNPNNLPSQFVFKKPLYNQHYHQTHFHHNAPPPSPPNVITPIHTQSTNNVNTTAISNKDYWSELRRFFANQPTESAVLVEDQPFANQFRQNISIRYGQWGKVLLRAYFCGILLLTN
jgi:hypothetical protein